MSGGFFLLLLAPFPFSLAAVIQMSKRCRL